MLHSDETSLKLATLPTILQALDVNEPKVGQKATMLSYSGILLMAAIFLFSAHFIYFIIDP
jgi:hypothetical protein